MYPQATEVVTGQEEALVEGQPSSGVGVNLRQPRADAVRVELVGPVSRGWVESDTSYCLSSPAPQHDT